MESNNNKNAVSAFQPVLPRDDDDDDHHPLHRDGRPTARYPLQRHTIPDHKVEQQQQSRAPHHRREGSAAEQRYLKAKGSLERKLSEGKTKNVTWLEAFVFLQERDQERKQELSQLERERAQLEMSRRAHFQAVAQEQQTLYAMRREEEALSRAIFEREQELSRLDREKIWKLI